MTSSAVNVFCDWLDVTFAPDDCPYPEMNLLLLGCGFVPSVELGSGRTYRTPNGRGTVRIKHSKRFAKISISGSSCAHLRAAGHWPEALSILASSPHKVSRLDAALDIPMDAAPFMDSLDALYPSGFVNLSRKAQRVTRFVSTRSDGVRSGTWYVGHKDDARQSLRVYDKSLEMLTQHREVIPTTTRVEVTARKDRGATLRDAELPTALFWDIASPAVFKRAPEGTPVWRPNQDTHWLSTPPSFVPAEVLKRRIEHSAELDAFLTLADSIGPHGVRYLERLLLDRLHNRSDSIATSDDSDNDDPAAAA